MGSKRSLSNSSVPVSSSIVEDKKDKKLKRSISTNQDLEKGAVKVVYFCLCSLLYVLWSF